MIRTVTEMFPPVPCENDFGNLQHLPCQLQISYIIIFLGGGVNVQNMCNTHTIVKTDIIETYIFLSIFLSFLLLVVVVIIIIWGGMTKTKITKLSYQ